MHKAVDGMKFESKYCFNFFMLQLFFFHISSFLLMWVLYDRKVAIFVNFVLGIFLIAFIKNGYDIYDNLALDENEAVTGVFQNFEQFEGLDDLGGRNNPDDKSDNSRRGANRLDNIQLGQGPNPGQSNQVSDNSAS